MCLCYVTVSLLSGYRTWVNGLKNPFFTVHFLPKLETNKVASWTYCSIFLFTIFGDEGFPSHATGPSEWGTRSLIILQLSFHLTWNLHLCSSRGNLSNLTSCIGVSVNKQQDNIFPSSWFENSPKLCIVYFLHFQPLLIFNKTGLLLVDCQTFVFVFRYAVD